MDSALSRPDGCCKGESGQVRIKTAAKAPTRRSPGGQVAQSVEQKTENLRVECSIHSLPTKKAARIKGFLLTDCASNGRLAVDCGGSVTDPAPSI